MAFCPFFYWNIIIFSLFWFESRFFKKHIEQWHEFDMKERCSAFIYKSLSGFTLLKKKQQWKYIAITDKISGEDRQDNHPFDT